MVLKELQQALRNLHRAPRFSLACVITLTVALAGTVTLINLLEAFVFRRMAVAAPEQLIGISPLSGNASAGYSPEALRSLSARQTVLTGVCGVTAGYGTLSVQFDSTAPTQRPVEAVSGNCYELLGVTPAVGRLFTTADVPTAGEPERVAVISDRVWQQEFGRSADVVGRSMLVEGTPLTIIGVLPMSYHGLNVDEEPAIALPLTLPWNLKLAPPLAMRAVGRLRPGIAVGEATAQLKVIWPDVFRTAQRANRVEQVPELQVVPLANGFSVLRERYRRPFYALAALAGSLLLLSCVSVGALSLARMLDRREMFAVQLALGAGRSRLAVQLLAEATLIGAAAILLTIPIARWGAQIAAHALWTGYRPFTLQPTGFAIATLATTFVGLVASLCVAVPGWLALFFQTWDLGSRSRGNGSRRGQRRAVIGGQIALCFTLTFCAVIFDANLSSLRQLPLGYEPGRLQWLRLDTTSRTSFAPTIGYADRLLSQVRGLPGVELAAMSQGAFGTTGQVLDTYVVMNDARTEGVNAISDRVSPEFFGTTSIPLQQGRDFTWDDVRQGTGVAILNRSLAHRLFPEGDGVGKTIRFGPGEQVASVVGIAADATPGDPRIQHVSAYYLPLSAVAPPSPAVLLRVRGRGVSEASLRKAIEPFGRHQVVRVSTMTEQVDHLLVQERLIASTSSLFAAFAALVCITGLYAALSQNIIRRRREIGIRIAVGATPNMVRALVFREVCCMLVIGLALGVPAALGGGQAARSVLSGDIKITTALAITGLATVGAAVLVSAWPAHRAASTQVATALRSN